VISAVLKPSGNVTVAIGPSARGMVAWLATVKDRFS
jgi:hypothetical protein